jgi:uncharacterized protein YggE
LANTVDQGNFLIQAHTFDYLERAKRRNQRLDLAVVDPPLFYTIRNKQDAFDINKEADMQKAIGMLTLLLGLAVPAAAQQFFPITHIPTIQVSGQASVSVEPDRAKLNMSVSEIKPTVNAAKSLVDQKVREIQQMLESMGIDRKQINASQLSIYRVSEDRATSSRQYETEKQYAYRVSRQINVTIMDIQQLDEILDQSIKMGTNRIWNISLYSSREEDLKLEALKLAAAKAERTAQVLASQHERKLAQPYMMEHEFGSAGGPVYRTAIAGRQAEGASEFARGTIEISAHVNVVYQME